jgi:hypothetical protein
MTRSSARAVWVVAVFVAAACLSLASQPGRSQDPAAQALGRKVCGPRCTEFVLHWYGKDEDVSDLTRELQNSRLDQMVSLAAIEQTLNKRGVHTRAVRVPDGGGVEWPYPVVVHLTQSDGAGHFVVRVPPKSGFPRLWWSGERGFERELPDDERQRLTGVVLLTAPEPIGDPQPAAARPAWQNPVWIGVGLVSGVGLLAVSRAYRRRSAGRPAHTIGE